MFLLNNLNFYTNCFITTYHHTFKHIGNDFDSLKIIKLRERSHSFAGFSTYVFRNFIDKYSDKKICDVLACLPVKEIIVRNTTKYNLIN